MPMWEHVSFVTYKRNATWNPGYTRNTVNPNELWRAYCTMKNLRFTVFFPIVNQFAVHCRKIEKQHSFHDVKWCVFCCCFFPFLPYNELCKQKRIQKHEKRITGPKSFLLKIRKFQFDFLSVHTKWEKPTRTSWNGGRKSRANERRYIWGKRKEMHIIDKQPRTLSKWQ